MRTFAMLLLTVGMSCVLISTPGFAKKKSAVQSTPTPCVVLPRNNPKWYAHFNSGLLPMWKGRVLGQAEILYNWKSDTNNMDGNIEVLVYPANSPSITSGSAWNDQLNFLRSPGFHSSYYVLSDTSATAFGLAQSLSGLALRSKDTGNGWFSVRSTASKGVVVIIRAYFTGAAQEKQVRNMLAALRIHPSIFKNSNYMPPAPPLPPITPVFSVVVNPGRAGSIENAVCKATVLNTGKVLTGDTDKNGKVSWKFPSTDATKPVKIRLDSVAIVPKTIYHTDTEQNSMIYGNHIITMAVNKELQLNPSNKFSLVYKQSVPLCRIMVNTTVWNPNAKTAEPCKCGVAIYNSSNFQLFAIRNTVFQKEGSLRILIPSLSVHGFPRLKAKGNQMSQQTVGIAKFDAPDTGNDSTAFSILLASQATHLAWTRDKMLKLWTPLVGAKTAARIANVNINFSEGIVSYLNGTITLPSSFDFTQDENSDNVLHEWTHHINETLFPNDEVEVDVRAGRQTAWAQSETLYSAWDEGRAHMLGQLMGQVFQAPNKNEFVQERADVYLSNLASNQGAGCEGVIATALLCHYGSGNYANAQEAIADIFAVHEQSIRDFGHEPYSIYDFLAAKQRLLKTQSASNGPNAAKVEARRNNLLAVKDNYKMQGGLRLGGQLEN